jgi:hypothetical protein
VTDIQLAEQNVLGSAMLNPDVADDLAQFISTTSFERGAHRAIWTAIRAVRDRGEPAEPMLVLAELGDRAQRAGGASYLQDLLASVLSIASAPHAGRQVAEAAEHRDQLARVEEHRRIVEETPDPTVRRARLDQLAAQLSRSGQLPIGDGEPREQQLFGDVAALLAGGIPEPPAPTLLRREDGNALLYAGKINILFGDPESGKTWVALAAIVEALRDGGRATFVDLDHNGMAEIVSRLLLLGAKPADLSDLNRFRYAEPEDAEGLAQRIRALRAWRPDCAVVDSIGEALPMLGLSSNSPDDYTVMNRTVLTPLSTAGAAVVGIDHMPKDDDARKKGQTGTLAKRRTVNGVTLRVSVHETFAPGMGGSTSMTVTKDRPGGVRTHCPMVGKEQSAGRFVMKAYPDGSLRWFVTTPTASPEGAPDGDVAELDSLDPPPKSQRDVQERCGWGGTRALRALRKWRELRGYEEV